VAVGLRGARPPLVEHLGVAGEQQHRDPRRRRIRLDLLADLVPALAGHGHVRHDQIRFELARLGDGLIAVVHRGEVEVLGGEGHPDHLAHGDGVVGDQHILRHVRASASEQEKPQEITAFIRIERRPVE
jgi:hypothetical protein